MDAEEYKIKRGIIDKDHKKRSNDLAMDYAFSNSKVIVGDIIEDHIGSIRVEIIRFHAGEKPACVYYGAELTKKMVPKKSGAARKVWQGNVIDKTYQNPELIENNN